MSSNETMLIGMEANYELTRFSDAYGNFTDLESSYKSLGTVRSFNQFESLLLEVFTEDASVSKQDTATNTSSHNGEVVACPTPVPVDSEESKYTTAPTLKSATGLLKSVNFAFAFLGINFVALQW
jgi:hypothetical protein